MWQIFHYVALVAQGIEHRIPNPGVARSIRAGGTIFFIQMSGEAFFVLIRSVLRRQQGEKKCWKELIV